MEVARNITSELAKNNDVHVYTTTLMDSKGHDWDPHEELFEGCHVSYFARNFRFGLAGQLNISVELLRAVQRNLKDFDVIHLHSWRQYEDYVICKYAPKYSIPYVLHAHGTLIKEKKRFIKQVHELLWGRKLLRNAACVIAISSYEANMFLKMGVPYEKVEIVHNGLNLGKFSSLPPRGDFRRQHDVSENSKVILYLGRLDPNKGIEFLVNAFAYAVKDLGLSNVVLAICGPDFGSRSKIVDLVKKHESNNRVLVTEMLSEEDKIRAYVDSDIVVYPEEFNVWALVVMEAAACGKPVIVSKRHYMARIVSDGEFGFSVEYGSTQSLGHLLKDALNDEASLRNMGLAGRRFVFKKFSWTNSINKLQQIYSEVASIRE